MKTVPYLIDDKSHELKITIPIGIISVHFVGPELKNSIETRHMQTVKYIEPRYCDFILNNHKEYKTHARDGFRYRFQLKAML